MARRRRKPRRKFALVVGIDRYQMPGLDLRGCVNDARAFYRVLKRHYGFRKKDIVVLTNHQATKDNILSTLQSFVAKSKANDEIVYYHSGHGTQIFDTSGDEKDRMDECLVPYDFDWDRVIIDDELHSAIKSLHSNAFLTLVIDTCFSGDIHKGVIAKTIRAKRRRRKRRRRFGTKESDLYNQRHILFSACSESQYSEEVWLGPKNGYRGIFSFFLTKILARTKGKRDWQLVYRVVRDALRRSQFSQNPNLIGHHSLTNRLSFGGKS